MELSKCINEPCLFLFVDWWLSVYPLCLHQGVLHVIDARRWSVYFGDFMLRPRFLIRLDNPSEHVPILVCLIINLFVFGAR